MQNWFADSGLISEHALHEIGSHRKLDDGTLGSTQERRAAVVPRINRGSTVGFVLLSVCIGFDWLVLPKTCPGCFSSIVWKVIRLVVSWANRSVGDPSVVRPCVPGTAVRRLIPARPSCVLVLGSTSHVCSLQIMQSRLPVFCETVILCFRKTN